MIEELVAGASMVLMLKELTLFELTVEQEVEISVLFLNKAIVITLLHLLNRQYVLNYVMG